MFNMRFITIILLLLIFLIPQRVLAQDYNLLVTNYQNLNQITPGRVVSFAVNLLLGLAGILAFIFLLVGGVQWITAGGEKDAVEKGRRKIVQALIGLTIVFSVYAIVFVINTVFAINIMQFTIPQL